MNEKEFNEAVEYLAVNDIALIGTKIWADKPLSVELETYTDAGEDMIVKPHTTKVACFLMPRADALGSA